MKQINAEKINRHTKCTEQTEWESMLFQYIGDVFPASLSSNFCCPWLYDTFFSKDGTAPDEGDFTQKMFMLADNGELDSGKYICEVCSFNLFVH